MNTTPSVKVKTKDLPLSITSLKMRAEAVDGESGLPGLDVAEFSFSGPDYSGESDLTTMFMAESLPNSVAIVEDEWKWILVEINGAPVEDIELGTTGTHKIYTTLTDPVAPMEKPWVPVLDFACEYAAGTTTPEAAMDGVVKGVYDDNVHKYDGGVVKKYWDYVNYFSFAHKLKLTKYLNDYASGTVEFACQDITDLCIVLASSLGGEYVYREMIPTDVSIFIDKVKAVGHAGWGINTWNNHFFIEKKDAGFGSKVWDACVIVDQTNPVRVRNMDFNVYQNKLLEDPINENGWENKRSNKVGEVE